MATTIVHCIRTIPVSADAVWQVIGGFDVSWHPGVASCALIRAADSALMRSFTDQSGGTYEERRRYLSDTDRVLCYTLTKGIEGLLDYSARIEVTEKDGDALVSWHARISATSDRLEAIADGTRAIFEAGLDTLASKPKAQAIARPAGSAAWNGIITSATAECHAQRRKRIRHGRHGNATGTIRS